MSLARRHRDRHDTLRGGVPAGDEPRGPAASPPPVRKAKGKTKSVSTAARKAARDGAAAAVAAGVGRVPTASNDNAPVERREASPEARQRLAMAQAKRRLKALKSMEARAQLKRELMPEFEAWVAGVLDAADRAQDADPAFRAGQDDVVVEVLIWRLDVGDLDQAAHLFAFARRHGWGLPANFKRSLPVFVAEQAAEFANRELDADRDAPLTPLLIIEDQVAKEDMPDEVRAQLHKAIGREYARRAEAPVAEGESVMAGSKRARLEAAAAQLQRALELDARSGAKGDLGRVKKALTKEDTPPATPPAIKSMAQEPPAGGS